MVADLQASFIPLVMDGEAVHHEWNEKLWEGATFPTPFCVSNNRMTKALCGAATPCADLDKRADLVLQFTICKRVSRKFALVLDGENLDSAPGASSVACFRNACEYPSIADQIRPVSSTLGGMCGSY